MHATAPLAAGLSILTLLGRPTPERSRLTIQIAADLHLAPDGAAWGMMNHACRPNCAIDFRHWTFVARRPIAAGEELTWHCLTTEWELAAPFRCGCGAADCLGEILGSRHLPAARRAPLLPWASPAVRDLHARDAPRPMGTTGAHRHVVA